VVIGFGTAVVAWLLARWVQDRVTDDAVPAANRTMWQRVQAGLTPTVPVPANLLLRLIVLVAGLVLFFVVGLFPDWFADHLGVIATALAALLAATLVVGGCVVLTQDRRSAEVFWLNGIQLTTLPVATLLLLTIAWTTGIGSNVDIHGCGVSPPRRPHPPGRRPTDLRRGDVRLARRDPRVWTPVTVGSVTYRLRPMFMLAAEGGGSGRRTGPPPPWTSSAGRCRSRTDRSAGGRASSRTPAPPPCSPAAPAAVPWADRRPVRG
jgi:hypothetical protein